MDVAEVENSLACLTWEDLNNLAYPSGVGKICKNVSDSIRYLLGDFSLENKWEYRSACARLLLEDTCDSYEHIPEGVAFSE